MGATHLPSTEFDGTEMDDQLEAEAEAQLGAPAEPMVQLLAPDGTLGSDPVFSKYAEKLDPAMLRGFYADMAKIRRFDGQLRKRTHQCGGSGSDKGMVAQTHSPKHVAVPL